MTHAPVEAERNINNAMGGPGNLGSFLFVRSLRSGIGARQWSDALQNN